MFLQQEIGNFGIFFPHPSYNIFQMHIILDEKMSEIGTIWIF